MKISTNFRRMSQIYTMFCDNTNPCFDFSEIALSNQYKSESLGGIHKFSYDVKFNGCYNGYAVGKHWMDVTVKMWLEDINHNPPVLFSYDLILDVIVVSDDIYWKWPSWFLSKVIKKWSINHINSIRQSFSNITEQKWN